ncbi:MAG: hypothetical protein AB1405_18560, partial [Bdellovibrionota bacterium]
MYRCLASILFLSLSWGCVSSLEPWNYAPQKANAQKLPLWDLPIAFVETTDARELQTTSSLLKSAFFVLPGALYLDFEEESPFLTSADRRRAQEGWEARQMADAAGRSFYEQFLASGISTRVDYAPRFPRTYPVVIKSRIRGWSWKRRYYPYGLGLGAIGAWALLAPSQSWRWNYEIEVQAQGPSGALLAQSSAKGEASGLYILAPNFEVERMIRALSEANQKAIDSLLPAFETLTPEALAGLENDAKSVYCQDRDPEALNISLQSDLAGLRASRCV